MSVYKEEKTGTWKVYYRYTDWQGNRRQTTKRGFPTKREALSWEREQFYKVTSDVDMTFENFVETYTVDMKSRVKENTWHTKEHNSYLVEVNDHAEEMYLRLVEQMKANEGITEELKAENQMEWVRKMNNIVERAREVVNEKLIYNVNYISQK